MDNTLNSFIDKTVAELSTAQPELIFQHSELSKIGLFYGASGIAYFLFQASCAMADPTLMRHADRFCSYAEAIVDDPFPEVYRKSYRQMLPNVERSIVTGRGGVGYARALLASGMGASGGVKAGVGMLIDAWNGTKALGAEMPLELHMGAAGFTCATTDLLERITDLRPAEREALTLVQRQSNACILDDLRRPFSGRTDYIGMAHGVAGPLYACLRASGPLEIVARRMEEFVDIAIDQPPLIQWPSALDSRELDGLPTSVCRGLSGVLILLCAAAKVLRSERIAGFAARAAFTSRKLHSGHPSLCCGSAGQAIAVSHYAAFSGCSASRRWSRSRLQLACEGRALAPYELWQGRPGVALAALVISGKGALPLLAHP